MGRKKSNQIDLFSLVRSKLGILKPRGQRRMSESVRHERRGRCGRRVAPPLWVATPVAPVCRDRDSAPSDNLTLCAPDFALLRNLLPVS